MDQLKIRFLEIYEKYPQFVMDAGSKWGLKSVQYERHMKLCFKRHAEDGRISLDVACHVLPHVQVHNGPGKEKRTLHRHMPVKLWALQFT